MWAFAEIANRFRNTSLSRRQFHSLKRQPQGSRQFRKKIRHQKSRVEHCPDLGKNKESEATK
jgi:hypothetical protein